MAKIFETGYRPDLALHFGDVGEALFREHVPARRSGLVHHREPVAGVALQALGERRRRGSVGGAGRRWGPVQILGVPFAPLDRGQDGVVVDGVGFVPRAKREDPGVQLDAEIQLVRGAGGSGERRGKRERRG